MTVAELIAKLEVFDPDLPVLLWSSDGTANESIVVSQDAVEFARPPTYEKDSYQAVHLEYE